MNGPDSISDPVARRISYTGSCPSARGSARLQFGSAHSARLGSNSGPTVLTCQLTGCWHGMPPVHANITITSCWCHPWHAYCACWHHNYVMLTSLISGSVTWVGSTGIRVGSAHPGEEDAWHAWGASARVGRRPAGEWWRVRLCPTSEFDAVFTSGFVSASSTQWYGQNTILTTFIFEQKSNTPLNHQLWYQLLGNPAPHARTGGVLIVAQRRVKHTDTIFYVVRQNRLHPREKVHIIRDI
jgi:hypothetical protein